MGDELIGGLDTLDFQERLLQLVVVLHPEHLDRATNADTEQGTPGRVRVAWPPSMHKGGFILIRIAMLLGRSVHDVVRFLESSEGGPCAVAAVTSAYLWGDDGQPVAAHDGVPVVDGIVVARSRERTVESAGKDGDGDPSNSVDDGQVRGVSRAPFQVHQGDGRRALDGLDSGGLTQTPRAGFGMATQEAKLERLSIRGQVGDCAYSRPGDGPGVNGQYKSCEASLARATCWQQPRLRSSSSRP